jgi:hypothetical protein
VIQGWIPDFVFLAVTTFVGLWARGRWFNPVGDAGIWWSLIERLSAGEKLYRDVYLQYGPFSPYLLSFGARLFGLSAGYMIIANWVAAIAAGILLLRIARRLLSELERLAVVGLLLTLSLFAPGAGPLVLPYAPAAVHALALSLGALLLLDGKGREQNKRTILAGLLAGLAFAAKQEIGVAVLLSLVAYVFLAGKRRPRLSRLLIGFASAVVLAMVYVLAVAPDVVSWRRSRLWPLAPGVSKAWRDLFRNVTGMSGPDWDLLVRGSVWTLLALLVLLVTGGLLAARERRRRPWLLVGTLAAVVAVWWMIEGYLLVGRFSPACLSMFVSLSVAVWSLADRRMEGQRRALLFAIALFCTINGSRTAFSADLGAPYSKVSQFGASLSWVLFTCHLVPGVMTRSAEAAKSIRALGVAVLLLVSWRGVLGSISNLAPLGVEPLRTRRGTVYVSGAQKTFLSAIQAQVGPGETAVVLPQTNAVDVLFGVRDISPWLIHVPGWLDEATEHELLRRFERKPPDVIVLFHRPTWEFRVGPFGVGYGQELARWIAQRYRAVAAFPEGAILRPQESGQRFSTASQWQAEAMTKKDKSR